LKKFFFYNDPVKTVEESLILIKERLKECKECTSCIMNSSIDGIEFNEKGTCEFCLGYNSYVEKFHRSNSSNAFLETIKKIKTSKNSDGYDCILGISGGVDSSYLALKCHEWGLNPLLVLFDNGWNTEAANNNIQAICEETKFDLYTYVVNWDEFKDLQLSFLKSGTINFEIPSDHGIFACLNRTARKKKIKYLLTGVNYSTETLVSAYKNSLVKYPFGYSYIDLNYILSIHKQYGRIKIKSFPKLSILEKIFFEKFGFIKKFEPLNYINFNKNDAIKELQMKTRWRPYQSKHFESIVTRFFQSYILPVKFNLDKRVLHLSNLIWSKQITKKQANDEMKKKICEDNILLQDYYFFLKKLDLTQEEFKNIIFSDNKDFSHYDNSESFINFLKIINNFIKAND
jgi:N-acetyl sugar amidotransferase